MNRIRATIIFSVLIAIGFSSVFFSSCRKKSKDGMIIFTQVSGDHIAGIVPQVQIVAIYPDKSGTLPEILTKDYYSAQSPAVSYDGTCLIFTARKNKNDLWQIYEMNLEDLKIRQVTSFPENCFDPAYLPGDRLVFSKVPENEALKTGSALFTCKPDGSEIKQITFNPHAYSASTVLKDGRVLTISREQFPYKGDPGFMVLRPDGTKAELFYKDPENSKLSSRGWETINGNIVFIESDKNNQSAGSVISISYNRPLHSRVNLTSVIKGDFHTVFPLSSGMLLVTYRKSETDRYALYEFDPENKVLGQIIYGNNDFDILEAVEVKKHERPKNLPSEVDMGVKTGLLLCQDINVIEMHSTANASALPKAYKIQVIGRDSTLGVVEVEEDGSFYLKVIADTPFQLQSIDEKGHILNGPSGWIWLRPNERRGCVGCHEDHEMAPGNRLSLAVNKPPVGIPVHMNKVVEKTISLE